MNVDEYRKLADVEDRMWYFRALHRHVERHLVRSLGESTVQVLDAGCGTGGLIRRLAPAHPTWAWTGIDVSSVACSFARRRVSRTEIHEGSITKLPFADDSFDAVVSADVLYHLDDDRAALREFHRVLRPGGMVIINVPAYRWLWSYHDTAVHSRRRYSRREVGEKLRGAQFEEIEATYWNSLPLPLVVVRRKLLPPPKDGSDVHLFPAPVEAAFDGAMALERGWLRMVGTLPFGTSVFAVARKSA